MSKMQLEYDIYESTLNEDEEDDLESTSEEEE